MLAAVVEKPGELAVREVPEPTIDETECLCEMLACSICNSTDRKILDGHFRYKGPDAYPGILGHEGIGRVVECGSRVESFKEGDIVIRAGAGYSEEEAVDVSSMWGGIAEIGKVKDPLHGGNPMHQIVPPQIDPVDATMLVTLKETLSWLQRWEVKRGESMLILGSGPVGISFGFFAKLLGCHPVLVLGRRDEPLARAMRLGIDGVINTSTDDPAQVVRDWTDGEGPDRIIEAVGDDSLVELGLGLLKSGGYMAIYGVAPTRKPGDMERRNIDIAMARTEWNLQLFGPEEWKPHQHMLWLVQQGFVHLSDYYTHTVPIEQTQRAFDLLASKEAFKVVVTMGD